MNFSLLEYVPIGICIIDNSYRIVFWNFLLEQWTGFKSSDIMNKNILELFTKLTKEKYKFQIDSVLNGGPPIVFSSQLHKNLFTSELSKDRQRFEQITVTAISDINNNHKHYAMFSVQDVTDLTKRIIDYKKLRDSALIEIIQRKKVESELKIINSTKDKFFSIIAHDLKSPLGTLRNITQSLFENPGKFDETEKNELFLLVKESISNIYTLLENLLEWSRSQRGIIKFNPSIVFPYFLVNSCIDILKPNAENKNIKFDVKIPKVLTIQADATLLNTIFRNLISNAIKFTHQNGKIEIGIDTKFKMSCEADKNKKIILFYVKDSGIGIKPEVLEKLFKIDENVTTIGTNHEVGTGLGLILCKEFIDKHNGKIWVESEVDVGSTFYFCLPE